MTHTRAGLIGAFLLAAACGGDGGPSGPGEGGGSGVASVAVSPTSATLTAIDGTVQLTATARDEDGRAVSGVSLTWSSSNQAVATVSQNGLVTARGNGPATITAAASGRQGTAAITVSQQAQTIAVTPPQATFAEPGEEIQFEARAEDANGHPVADAAFTWSSTNEDVVTVTADGLATARSPGDAAVRAALDGAAGESPVTVEVGSSPFISSISPDPLVEGAAATLTGGNFGASAGGNVVRVDGVEASVTGASATQLQIVVPTFDCLPSRTVEVRVTAGGKGGAPRSAELVAAEGGLQLARGEYLLIEDPGAFCLRFDEGGQPNERYLVGVQSGSGVATSLTPVTMTSVTSAAGAAGAVLPGMSLRSGLAGAAPGASGRPVFPERRRAHREAEAALREWERRTLFPGGVPTGIELARPGPRGDREAGEGVAARAAVAAVPQVGEVIALRVPNLSAPNLCVSFTDVQAVVRAVGTRGVWLEDPDNPAGGFTAADFQTLSDQFDDAIHATNVAYLGDPTDMDANERVLILVSRIVNIGSNALGFVFIGDFASRSSCASSDQGEIFYGRAPDPNGIAGQAYATADALLDYPWLIAHELAHVIQIGRRISPSAPLLDTWMMEGQATMMEEVVGHAVTGRSAGQDYGFQVAFNTAGQDEVDWYVDGFVDLAFYFGFQSSTSRIPEAPHECGWLGPDPSPCVGRALWYGVGWSLLRWVSDQFAPSFPGGETAFHRAIVDDGLTGFDPLTSLTGETKERLLGPWAATLYLDGRLTGMDPRLEMTSWNVFDVFSGLVATAQLQPPILGFTDFQEGFSVRAGSTAYFVFFGSNRPETAVRVRDPADQPLAAAAQVWVVRLQ